jgi:PAS domain S-box-containing protein
MESAEVYTSLGPESYGQLIEDIQDFAIFILDQEGRVQTWNKGAEGVFCYTDDEILGKHFSCLFLDEDVSRGVPQQELQRAAEDGRASDDRWLVRRDGRRIWVEGCLVAIKGGSRGFGKIVRDQTRAKTAADKIHQLNVELQSTVDRLQSTQTALQEKVNELERFGDVVVGRELKMMAYEKERQSFIEEIRRLKAALNSRTETRL